MQSPNTSFPIASASRADTLTPVFPLRLSSENFIFFQNQTQAVSSVFIRFSYLVLMCFKDFPKSRIFSPFLALFPQKCCKRIISSKADSEKDRAVLSGHLQNIVSRLNIAVLVSISRGVTAAYLMLRQTTSPTSKLQTLVLIKEEESIIDVQLSSSSSEFEQTA
ncbi:hypothetical protein E5288_WYG018109 [Bos mutus]|uniref:Uncharacterized protein n=1 Tax=Bos mutus TaxID=72004 RepID=A0A6B0REN3_9CETA|nr:hypothetical protein [Bos mutus]